MSLEGSSTGISHGLRLGLELGLLTLFEKCNNVRYPVAAGLALGVSVSVAVGASVDVSLGDRGFAVGADVEFAVKIAWKLIYLVPPGPPQCSATCCGMAWKSAQCPWKPVESAL